MMFEGSDVGMRRKPGTLTKAQIKALKELGPPGRFRVGWRPPYLSWRGYKDLRERGLIKEQWTWCSTTLPDVGLTDAGLAARGENKKPASD